MLLPIPDVSTRSAALLSGRVDWIEAPAPDSLDKLKSAGCKIETNAIPHMWPYTLSMLPGAPTADIRVRKAMNLAIDRDAIVKVLNGLAAPAVGCVPPDNPWFGSPSFKIKYDPARGKKLLAEAGYGPGKKLKTKIAISTSGSGQMYPLIMNEAIQQQWAEGRHRCRIPGHGLERAAEPDAPGGQVAGRPALQRRQRELEHDGSAQRLHALRRQPADPAQGLELGATSTTPSSTSSPTRRATRPIPRSSTRCWPGSTPRWSTMRVFVWVVHDVWPNAISSKVKGYVHPKSWYVDFSPVTVG